MRTSGVSGLPTITKRKYNVDGCMRRFKGEAGGGEEGREEEGDHGAHYNTAIAVKAVGRREELGE